MWGTATQKQNFSPPLQTSYVSNRENGIPEYLCSGYYGQEHILWCFRFFRHSVKFIQARVSEKEQREAVAILMVHKDTAGMDHP